MRNISLLLYHKDLFNWDSMELSSDWLTRGIIDYEYKKYQLLAYLKNVKAFFAQSKLYPSLGDLVFHYNNLKSLSDNKLLWYERFPESLEGIDLQKLRMNYQKLVKDDEIMSELEQILHYAIPQLRSTVKEGREIYEYVSSTLEITPVGISPLYLNEGYMFVHQPAKKNMRVYQYTITVFEKSSEKYRGIQTRYLQTDPFRKFVNLESRKLSLVKKFKDLPNPATYFITSKNGPFPFNETFFPIVKRNLVKYILTTEHDGHSPESAIT